jgi:Arc/MetJ family transcription regulator
MKTTLTNNNATAKIESREKTWGFYGTFKSKFELSDADMAEVFNRAARFTAERLEMSTDAARRFLDSKLGRHLADAFSEGDLLKQKLDSLYGSWKRDVREFRTMAINSTDEDFYS